MARTSLLAITLALAISIQGTLGDIHCEDLNENSCAFAVSSTGNRCVLESRSFLRKPGSSDEYTCRTSEITASNQLTNYIETEECVTACGVDMRALGISSDSLLDRNFVDKFCSEPCYKNCPNIVDLYFNLAAGEGVYIPKFCEMQRSGARRGMIELNSYQASDIFSTESLGPSPAPAPSPALY
ncbi:PAR1 protein [Striga asiatica]|uniref:PAR1 protein n=1 Tax=Striga asiatica TaxID=4170 RepID=A0A5A7QJU5_STRAF|nr:PAR1 protein [Striga asiatica]